MICSFATAKALIEILDINLVKFFPVICTKCNIIILHISRDSLSLRMETSWKPGQTSGKAKHLKRAVVAFILCRQELSSAFTFKDDTSSSRERKKAEVKNDTELKKGNTPSVT